MRDATEDRMEYLRCRKAFDAWMGRFYPNHELRKIRGLSLRGQYVSGATDEMWQAWRACWDYMKS